ncbi:MAG: RhuM family protein [Thermoanaerobaculaceae bacterium]
MPARKPNKAHAGASVAHEPAASYGGPAGEVVLYQAPDGTVTLDVRLDQETIWLSLNQMASLFGRDKSVVSRHLGKIFSSKELERDSVVALYATTASDGKSYQVEYFSLDAVISVGYRVNSKRGTQFRIWATRVLREHVLRGYTVNERRLTELKQAVRLVADLGQRTTLGGDEASALMRVVADYTFALDLLDDYDHRRVVPPESRGGEVVALELAEALRIVEHLRERFGGSALFGREKDQGLRASLGAVMQSVGGRDAYPGLEAKAANLLYLLVKNHPFVDGNKRIGAALFLWFLEKNGAIRRPGGERRLSEAALVAITLMIAESRPAEKDIVTGILTRLLLEPDGAGA